MDPEDGEDFEEFQELDENEDQQGNEPEDQQDDETDQSQEGDEEFEEEQPARQPSRGQRRIETLDRRAQEAERLAKEARDRAAELERQVQELTRGPARAEAERQERERLERMLPEERAEYIARQTQSAVTSQLEAIRRESAEATDRAEFAAACASNPTLAKVKDQVEAELANLRKGNVNVPRATLAAYIIGQQVLEKAPKARERAAKKAAANLDRERARPASGASDAPRGRDDNDKAARDKRLENYTF